MFSTKIFPIGNSWAVPLTVKGIPHERKLSVLSPKVLLGTIEKIPIISLRFNLKKVLTAPCWELHYITIYNVSIL